MAEQNNTNIGFEKQIWDAACVLWGHIPAVEYRKVIVGLIFLRYISSAFKKRYDELVAECDGFEDDRDAYAEDNISPDLDKRVLGDVVDLFTNMDMGNTKENKDLLGKTYQYCIKEFAAYEGVKGGEFYTPESIVKTIVAILKPYDNCRVYDPCCGSGGMFVQSADFIEAHRGNRDSISVYGQESNADTWKMAKMNMAIRGIDANFGPYQADTFEAFQNGTLEAIKGFCSIAGLQEIENQDFILTPGRYVGIEEVEDDGEPFGEKMSRLTSELSDMFAKSHELEEEIRKKLGAIGYEV